MKKKEKKIYRNREKRMKEMNREREVKEEQKTDGVEKRAWRGGMMSEPLCKLQYLEAE